VISKCSRLVIEGKTAEIDA